MPPMTGHLDALMRPKTVAVVGASAKRQTRGNLVLANLRRFGFTGTVLPVHPNAESVEGLPAAAAISDLPPNVDAAVLCVAADRVADTLLELDRAGCRAAVSVSAGFSRAEEDELRRTADELDIVMHGPNCMGIVNVTDSAPLYMGKLRDPLPSGNVALVAQSGSVAIALMNSPGLGFSKIVSTGNEYALTSADYMRWLAADDATQAVGMVVETIPDPELFAAAVEALHEAGKAVVVLRAGRSSEGSRAAQAHTGALVSSHASYEAFFRRYGVPTASDYDEMVATLQCFAVPRRRRGGPRVGIVGISGGEAALACDVAREVGCELAAFTPSTVARIESILPGASGQNPIDFGASVARTPQDQEAGLRAVVDDDEVDAVLVLQDSQSTLPLDAGHFYLDNVGVVARVSGEVAKPVTMASSTSPNTHPLIEQALGDGPVALLRGIRPALTALRNVAVRDTAASVLRTRVEPVPGPDRATLRELRLAASRCGGPLPQELAERIMVAYGIPILRSVVARGADDAIERAGEIGYPVVVKVASQHIPHRTEVGGVELDIRDANTLRAAIESIDRRVREHVPQATIDGFEVQPALSGAVEAVAGFTAEDPFGALMLVGSGGTLVELMKDRAVDLAPLSPDEASTMIDETWLGPILDGYRRRIPPTDPAGLADVLVKLSALAIDLCDVIAEADLNPVLIATGTGEVRVADCLLISGPDRHSTDN